MLARLVGMSFAFGDSAWYLPLAHEYPGAPDPIGVAPALKLLKGWLESARHRKVGQNLKFDAHILANHGVALAGIAHGHAAGILRLRSPRAP
jgi:DNA polymerase-1